MAVERCIGLAIECSECPSRQRRASFTSSSGDHFVLSGFRGMALRICMWEQNRKAARLRKARPPPVQQSRFVVGRNREDVAPDAISHRNRTAGKGCAVAPTLIAQVWFQPHFEPLEEDA